MGLLIRLKSPINEGGTALKSLKYGHDRPGGGDSGQPYIISSIDQPSSISDEDTILRGGLKAPSSALEDVSRLTQYFFDSKNPDGLLFIEKQNILSRISPKTEAFNGIYTPSVTLGQAGVGYLGTHFLNSILSYQTVAYSNNANNNRLIQLKEELDSNYEENNNNPILRSYDGGPGSNQGIGETQIKFATKNNSLIPLKTTDGLSYPQINYTRPIEYNLKNIFGKKESKFYKDSTNGSNSVSLKHINKNNTSENDLFGKDNYIEGNNGISPDNRLGITTNSPNPSKGSTDSSKFLTNTKSKEESKINLSSTTSDDFRKTLFSDYSKTFLGAPYDSKNNIETLFNLGNPGQQGDLSDYKKGKHNGQPLDKVNASYIYKSDTPSTSSEYDDLIPFVIGILNNEGEKKNVKYMHFRAFIKKMSDSYKADWKSIEYMGRAENFYRYKGFDRDMSIGFTVVAQSVKEQNSMYDKLNFLASSLAPEYLINGYMAGNIAYLTIGDYIVDQPGIITSLGFDIPDDSPWETGRERDGSLYKDPQSPKRLPHMIDVDLKFIPIHTFRPQKLYFENTNKKVDDENNDLPDLGIQKYINPSRKVPENISYTKEGKTLFSYTPPASTSPTSETSPSSTQPLGSISEEELAFIQSAADLYIRGN